MVDGVLASCYPSADHDLLDFGMLPLRWFAEAIEWIIGDDNGVSGYVKITAHLAQWFVPHGVVNEESHIFQ